MTPLKKLTRQTANVNHSYPERILQFGGGNFLRGFVDWIIDKYNRQSNDDKLGILVVKVREEGSYQKWKDQDGLFHFFSQGFSEGKTINDKILITSVVRILEAHQNWEDFINSSHQPALNVIISNTTEVGLEFSVHDLRDRIPSTFPGQLCKWLHERYKFFKGDKKASCTSIPCELIENNGHVLKESLLKYAEYWQLEQGFKNWIDEHCNFCNTLVDRIVPGIKQGEINSFQERLGFEDLMMTKGEPYHLWAIESKRDLGATLPLNRIGLNVIYTGDLSPFRERKLKILNGAHTSMVPIGILLGITLVKEAVVHNQLGPFIKRLIFDEILPSIDINPKTSTTFAEEVLDRFKNPFLEHHLAGISLYSISKFSTRIKPTIKAYVKNKQQVPRRIMLSFACFLIYYSGELHGKTFVPKDQEDKTKRLQGYMAKLKMENRIEQDALTPLLADTSLWNEDLNKIKGFAQSVSENLNWIQAGSLEVLVEKLGK